MRSTPKKFFDPKENYQPLSGSSDSIDKPIGVVRDSSGLLRAIRQHSLENVRAEIQKGVDLSQKDSIGQIALHLAAARGDSTIINKINSNQVPIASTLSLDSVHLDTDLNILREVIQGMLRKESPASLNAANNQKITPLHIAAFAGHQAIVQALLEARANPDSQDSRGRTPLYWSVHTENMSLIKTLLSFRAQVNLPTKAGVTPLHVALSTGHFNVIQLLLQNKGDVGYQNGLGQTPLHYISDQTTSDMVKQLVSSGAKVNCVDQNSDTPLHLAYEKGNIGVIRALIQAGAPINAPNHFQNTPLHLAALHLGKLAKKDQIALLHTLIQAGADVGARDKNQSTPLHLLFSFTKNLELGTAITVLLQAGADINAQDLYKKTPLHFAVQSGDLDVIRLLLQKGAQVDQRNTYHMTPLQDAFISAPTVSRNEIIKILIQRNADITAQPSHDSLLRLAIALQAEDIICLIIEKFSPNVQDQNHNNNTLLHFAAERGDLEIIQLLLDKGANINQKNNEGSPPLHHALRVRGIKNRGAVVNTLTECEADITLSDNNGNDALKWAIQLGDKQIVTLIKNKIPPECVSKQDRWERVRHPFR